jgi:autotransporter-associated beta strand protein
VIVGSTGCFGSLSKIGNRKLMLTNANLYDGGTTISRGKLVVNNQAGSGTGSGAVHVNSGTLGGGASLPAM